MARFFADQKTLTPAKVYHEFDQKTTASKSLSLSWAAPIDQNVVDVVGKSVLLVEDLLR